MIKLKPIEWISSPSNTLFAADVGFYSFLIKLKNNNCRLWIYFNNELVDDSDLHPSLESAKSSVNDFLLREVSKIIETE